MRIRDLATAYCECHSLADGSVTQLDIAVRHFERFFGEKPIEDLLPIDFARFSTHLRGWQAASTANKQRAHLLAVLRWGAEMGLLPSSPAGDSPWESWRKAKEPRKAPVAFLSDEFQAGLSVAREWPGWICGVPAAPWWESLLLSVWYSGARIGALLQVEWQDVVLDRPGFFVRWQAQKQKADQFFAVGPDCAAAIQRARLPERRLVWPWELRREALYEHFRKIFTLAGVKLGKDTGCLFHRIRKSTASYTRAGGGNATAQLGHSCSSVTERYYDPRICGAHDATIYMPALSR